MRLIYTGLAVVFIKQASAGFALIEEALQAAGRKNNTMDGPGLRRFNTFISDTIATIKDGWGCWCYFDDESYQGRGNPLNDVDNYCKVLQQGYECFEMDDGNTCMDPWDVNYAYIDLQTVVNEDYASACEIENGRNNCARMACIIESRFSDKILKYRYAGGTFDPALLHSDPNWDIHSQCPIKVTTSQKYMQKECCGEYPIRFPFKQSGDRGCCQGTTFDEGIFQCCQDGSIEIVCDNP